MFCKNLDQLQNWLTGADAAGLHVAIHAIGDQANDSLLERLCARPLPRTDPEVKGMPDRRFRIEHAQHLTLEAIERFAELMPLNYRVDAALSRHR